MTLDQFRDRNFWKMSKAGNPYRTYGNVACGIFPQKRDPGYGWWIGGKFSTRSFVSIDAAMAGLFTELESNAQAYCGERKPYEHRKPYDPTDYAPKP